MDEDFKRLNDLEYQLAKRFYEEDQVCSDRMEHEVCCCLNSVCTSVIGCMDAWQEKIWNALAANPTAKLKDIAAKVAEMDKDTVIDFKDKNHEIKRVNQLTDYIVKALAVEGKPVVAEAPKQEPVKQEEKKKSFYQMSLFDLTN